MAKTTVQINLETLKRLKSFKKHPRESYDEILNDLLDDAEDDKLTDEEIEDLKKALEEIKRGETVPIEAVAKEFGIKLN